MWSDNETAVDFLGYKHLVAAVTSMVQDDSLLPATIGIFGDWGGGKSSLLKMAEAELAKDADTLVLTFNGWLFEGYEDARSALIGVTLDEIASKRNLTEKGQGIWKKLVRRVNWFRVAGSALKHGTAFAIGGPAGLGLTVAADMSGYVKQIAEKLGAGVKEIDLEDIGKYITDESGQEARRAVRDFREDFKALLSETKLKRLVVFIDDLDRCLPDSIIEILEAIKLFLFVEHTAFVIGADERLVRYAVRRRFPEIPGDSAGVANEYLEKLIQYPVRIPPLDGTEMETYINLLFAAKASLLPTQFEKVRDHVVSGSAEELLHVRFNAKVAQALLGEIPQELKEQLAIAQRIAPVLASGLKGNPRQCKRFLNTLSLRVTMAKSRGLDLKQRVLAKLMLVEYLKPEWFRQLATLHATLGTSGQLLARLEQTTKERRPEAQDGSRSEAPKARRKKSEKRDLEPESESPVAPIQPIPVECENWLSDPWMRQWMQSDPPLSGETLQPYFFFSRDRLGSIGTIVRGMSPSAQETLQKLLHDSEAQRSVAVRGAAVHSEADAAAIFQAMTERIELQEDLRGQPTTLLTLCDWCKMRPELLSQTLSFVGRLPVLSLPMNLSLKIVDITRGTAVQAQAKDLLTRWSKDTTATQFAHLANSSLRRFEG